MNREELLSWFHSLPFNYIDPPDVEDIGFTERPIWINTKGYGYLACDDPSEVCWAGSGVAQEKWSYIRDKLSNGKLLYSDIQGTSLVDLLSTMTFCTPYIKFELSDDISEYLQDLLVLPENEIEKIFGMADFAGWLFFESESDFKQKYERDWCDVYWDELEDDELLEWHRCLTEIL